MSTMENQDLLKKIVVSVITLSCLTFILGLIFQGNLGDVVLAFSALSLPDILWLFVLSTSYQMLDATACLILLRMTLPSFPYRIAWEVIYLGVFSKISTLGAGIIPIQAYYLHRNGIEVGQGIGTMVFSYVMHKTAVLMVASIFLLVGQEWIYSLPPSLHAYLIAGYLICLVIILVLLLLCVWGKAHYFAVWVFSKLPEHGKWFEKKHTLREQLDHLYYGSTSFLTNKKIVLATLLIHTFKLLTLCAVPHACIRVLGDANISLTHVEFLMALILLIESSTPNIAGMGPTEASYFLLFNPLLGNAMTASSLLLFRITTYYFPFLVSVIVFLNIKTRLISKSKTWEVQQNENWCH